MSNYVKISTLGMSEPDFSSLPKDFAVYEKEMKNFLTKQLDKVLPDRPDLIVFPECANRYVPNNIPELHEYYKYLGDRMIEFLKPYAIDNNTNIAYSAYRYVEGSEPKPFRNSNIYIGRDGEIKGIYDKNHICIGEYEDACVSYSDDASLTELDFGKVATAICFDLNFDELMYKYASQKPDLIVHSSMYHGGRRRQAQWAYTCRSFFVGSVGFGNLPCTILNPYGDVVAESTGYTDHVSAKINLDYELCHIDYNREKFAPLKAKYKDAVTIYDPGLVGSVMISSEISEKSAREMIKEFDIELLDDYFARARAHRKEHLK